MIRKAENKDAGAIQNLLAQMGYPTGDGLVANRLETLAQNPEHFDLVYEQDERVVGFISFHLIPQITMDNNYALVSYLVVDDQIRSRGVGKALEMHCVAIAETHKCKRILLNSNIIRTDAHRFYLRQGYEEYQKTFIKYL